MWLANSVRQARFVSVDVARESLDARQQFTIFKEGGPGYTKYIVYTADNSDRKWVSWESWEAAHVPTEGHQ